MKRISCFIAIILLLTLVIPFAASAANGLTFEVSKVAGCLPGETVEVSVYISGNDDPGITATDLTIVYDKEILELTGVKAGDLISDSEVHEINKSSIKPDSFTISSMEPVTAPSGQFLILTFDVLQEGTSEVSIKINDLYNGFLEEITDSVAVNPGSVQAKYNVISFEVWTDKKACKPGDTIEFYVDVEGNSYRGIRAAKLTINYSEDLVLAGVAAGEKISNKKDIDSNNETNSVYFYGSEIILEEGQFLILTFTVNQVDRVDPTKVSINIDSLYDGSLKPIPAESVTVKSGTVKLGHDWTDATCTAPKTCSVCGETEGEALGHDWTDATCTTPKTCSVCGETEGEALGHSYGEWIAEVPATCEGEGTLGFPSQRAARAER